MQVNAGVENAEEGLIHFRLFSSFLFVLFGHFLFLILQASVFVRNGVHDWSGDCGLPRTNEEMRRDMKLFLKCKTQAEADRFASAHFVRHSVFLSMLFYFACQLMFFNIVSLFHFCFKLDLIDFDFVRMVVEDPMHTACLGIVKNTCETDLDQTYSR